MFDLKNLIATLLPADLHADAERSLRTPQFGPYHNEGPFLDSHLHAVLGALIQISEGKFPDEVPEGVRELMSAAISTVGLADCQRYVLLHDLDKATCLTIVYNSGEKQAVTWEQWLEMAGDAADDGDALNAWCAEKEVKQISYYQDTPEVKRSHGKVTAERLAEHGDVSPLITTAVREHEMAFTFGNRGGINIPLAEKIFDGKSDIEVGFTLAVNLADQMGSHNIDGDADIADFVLMAESYLAWQSYCVVEQAVNALERVDAGKRKKQLSGLKKSTTAFADEDTAVVIERITNAITLPELDADTVRTALADVDGLPGELADRIVTDMTTDGKLSSDTGKVLRAFNRPVRQALAKIS